MIWVDIVWAILGNFKVYVLMQHSLYHHDETDRIGRPYQFVTVGGPIETERTGIGWHWFGYGYRNYVVWTAPLIFL